MMNGDGDEILVEEIKNGNDAAFERIFGKYRTPLYAICYRYTRNDADARELVQDIFIKVYRHIKTFDGRSKFFTWLYRIAVNTCLSFRRQHDRRPPAAPESAVSVPMEERIIMKKAIDEALDHLPKRQRMVFTLRHFDGYSFSEIAAIMGITTGAAKANHYHAVRRLRSILKEWL